MVYWGRLPRNPGAALVPNYTGLYFLDRGAFGCDQSNNGRIRMMNERNWIRSLSFLLSFGLGVIYYLAINTEKWVRFSLVSPYKIIVKHELICCKIKQQNHVNTSRRGATISSSQIDQYYWDVNSILTRCPIKKYQHENTCIDVLKSINRAFSFLLY